MNKSEIQRINVALRDKETAKKLKLICIMQEKSVSEVIEELVAKYIDEHRSMLPKM